MRDNRTLENILQCTFGTHCHLCRNKQLGRAWREILKEIIPLFDNQIDFPCPLGKPWGYKPKNVPLTLREQQRYVCNNCKATACSGDPKSLADCPENKWTKTIDVIYPYLVQQAESDELRYSLRSLSNLREEPVVWIVGDKPEWLDTSTVNYIPHSRTSKNRDIDSSTKFKLAAQQPTMGNRFIYMNDDIYLMTPVSTAFLSIPRYLADYSHNLNDFKVTSAWHKTTMRGFLALKQKNYPARDYSLHWPYVFDTEKFLDLYREFQLNKTPHNPEIIYFNMHAVHPTPFAGELIRANQSFPLPSLYHLIQGAIILNNKKNAFNTVSEILADTFPNKSIYELSAKNSSHKINENVETTSTTKTNRLLTNLLSKIRSIIFTQGNTNISLQTSEWIFKPEKYYTLITIHQRKERIIRWGSKRKSVNEAITHNINRILRNERLKKKVVQNPTLCAIKFEAIYNETAINIDKTNLKKEYMTAGLKIEVDGNIFYLLPSDSILNNYNTLYEKIFNLIKSSQYLSHKIIITDLQTKSYKRDARFFLVYSHWGIDMNHTLYTNEKRDMIPENCKLWRPFNPVKSR